MLIINADDWGMNAEATDRIRSCIDLGRVTSVSGMVYMADSKRSASEAIERGLDVGLHLNFITPYTASAVPSGLIESHRHLQRFLGKSRYHSICYHPALKKYFEYSFRMQYEEFVSLYAREPSHIDGHRHLHLCMNVVLDGILPSGARIRRSHTFSRREKDPVNRFLRRIMDRWLVGRYRITDYFFDLWPFDDLGRIRAILMLSEKSLVELMVHPERTEQLEFITGPDFGALMQTVCIGDFSHLQELPNASCCLKPR
jgi:chitin disaccharide deacetylase